MQPQEVTDVAHRLAYLALTDPHLRPIQSINSSSSIATTYMQQKHINNSSSTLSIPNTFRYYDAVGPETISMVHMLQKFAEYQGSKFRPVFIDYRNMERVLNIKSLGRI